ncbi:MAG: energy-coupling factor ABC transporter ATP-binding protein [archaeon]|nr:energy-coupling factor ABC transporter ATP-binding protein [archaeon]
MKDVSFTHSSALPNVLDSINLSVTKGSRSAIMGANGAGKTTFFYTLMGVYKPQKGEVLFDGEPIEYSKKGLSKVRSKIGMVLQNPDEQLFSTIVEEDIAFGPMNLGIPRDEIDIRIDRALKDVRMTGYRSVPLHQLSGGQRKRIAIAGALAVQPEVMIMDEPTAGLDPQASLEVMELAEKLHLRGVTVLVSTHDVDLAYSWCDDVHVLRHGKCIYSGTSEGFYSDRENVYLSGLLQPSTYTMNREIALICGTDESPYPRKVCEYLSKIGKGGKTPGTVYLLPYEEGTGLTDRLSKVPSDARVGVYGSDARNQASDERCRVDFYFDGLDSCFTDAVLGKDSVLVYDSVYSPLIEEQVAALKGFGSDISTEVVM